MSDRLPDRLKDSQNPTAILQAAIEDLELFTKSDASTLELDEDGRLVASKENHLERVVKLARCYIGSLLSDQVRQEQEKKLSQLKQAILRVRDIIQTHSALIEKFKEGNDSQQKLANYAIEAIQRYNAVVSYDSLLKNHYNIYNYERNRLLLDQEIKGHQIELPRIISIKYNSHPNTQPGAHPAYKMLDELRETLSIGAMKKEGLNSTYKKNIQFMMDTFRMKAIRMIQEHLTHQSSMSEIIKLIQHKPIGIDEEVESGLINMRQLLEVGPGSIILLTGCFNRSAPDSKLMTMPILDSFRLNFQLTHSGFPYPSQHTGWALVDKSVEAAPLRLDQVPLFHQIDQTKKRLAQQLLFDTTFIQKTRGYAKLKQEIFDQHRTQFLPLHRQMQEILRKEIFLEEGKEEASVLEAFYKYAEKEPSSFEILIQTQQQMLDLFIAKPLKALEDEWLGEFSLLRLGSPQEKFEAACKKLKEEFQKIETQLNPNHIHHAYILQQGRLLSKAFQPIILQYQSEKMGFAPPLLRDFERKLQACAFQQLFTFIDECENQVNKTEFDPQQIKENLLCNWANDLEILQTSEKNQLCFSIVDELEFYFNSRFYVFYSRHLF